MANKQFKYFDIIMALFVAVLLISNIASTKILALWKFEFDGGTLLFPLAYIFGDILTEVYGYRKSRRVIWTGFGCALLMSAVLMVVGALRPASGWENQAAYQAILGLAPRIVIASLIAYFAGEFSNSYILAKMKIWTAGRKLWLRTILSTLVGEGLDTALFIGIAFYGILPNELLMTVFISNYIFKCGVEILFTPVTYKVVAYLKKSEGEDHYDHDTNFNPFFAGQRSNVKG
ncbi:transporter [Candidatus Falkowbacteria bacterium RIFOXYB2_FULL_47_14]|uniref:Probable queuosine precursor transporter n=1 Tax=Candidatus Falkowbacteria bacterium RIFOXYA2_FULL_47_19 TaxID=1797994 RepID=A0A1F5SF18_9BACT|nr:MAG: transporter [Candidatus Falkowbacteria bacterium RIFOXYA2_FULL_47_19]OGF36358.1 MAG: transporter [Candidatus Falkowbacteria bacterium RIFOXYC2_FULL_46_15]OGF43331.1 MAG: transporter [Candidatus Falkowbacteria bacterium RIFOXYB2_FULL_47_14]